MRAVLSLALGLMGVWLICSTLSAVAIAYAVSDDTTGIGVLLDEGALAMRGVIGSAALLGGIAGLAFRDSTAWLTATCAFVYGVTVFALLASRAEVAEWRTSAISILIISGLLLCFIRARAHREDRDAPRADDETTAPPQAA